MSIPAIPVHHFHPDHDSGRDWRGQHLCIQCPLPKRHPVHDVPDRPPEDDTERIIGEREVS